MSGSKSNYLSKKLLERTLGGVAYVTPTNIYLAACTVLPDDTSTGSTITESDYGSYARVQIGTSNNQTDAFNAATGTTTATVTNKNLIAFPAAASPSTNPIVAVAILDAATLGNILYWMSVASTPIASGDTPEVNAAGMAIVED